MNRGEPGDFYSFIGIIKTGAGDDFTVRGIGDLDSFIEIPRAITAGDDAIW